MKQSDANLQPEMKTKQKCFPYFFFFRLNKRKKGAHQISNNLSLAINLQLLLQLSFSNNIFSDIRTRSIKD